MSWFDEDPELLRAALEIIESWDGPSSVNGVPVASSPSTEETDSANDEHDGEATSEDGSEDAHTPAQPSPSAPSTVSTKSAAKKGGVSAPRELKPSTVSSTRHKRREEIIYLRDKVKDMETQLLTLQKQHIAGGDESAAPVMNGVESALAVMWQDIAGRQQRLRHKAELEQAKLRELLETQMKVARGLIKLMQKARRIEDDESFPAAKRAKVPIDVSVGVSEETQRAHIEELYHRIEGSFTFSKFHDGTLKFIDVEVLDQGEDEVVIEFRDAWALPFETDEVMDAMWTFMVKRSGQGECRETESKVYKISDDTFTTHFTASSTVGALKGSFDGKAIHKKFAASAEHGPAIVSSMFAEPHTGKADQLDGIRMREDGWLRVIPARSLTGQSDGRTLSVVQSDRHFRLSFDTAATPASRRNAGVLTDFLLNQLMQEIQFKHETVETVLLHMRSQ